MLAGRLTVTVVPPFPRSIAMHQISLRSKMFAGKVTITAVLQFPGQFFAQFVPLLAGRSKSSEDRPLRYYIDTEYCRLCDPREHQMHSRGSRSVFNCFEDAQRCEIEA